MKARILIADRDLEGCRSIRALLEEARIPAICCTDGLEALKKLREEEGLEVVLADAGLPHLSGFQLLEESHSLPDPPVVVLAAGFGTIEDAVQAMRAGAFDYVTKPLVGDEILLILRRALEQRELRKENRTLKARLGIEDSLGTMVGRDPRMRSLFELVRTVAPTRATILISGESGTGKTLLARAIHRLSDRADQPFVEVSCGSLPDSLLESELFGHVKGAFTGAHRNKIGRFEQANRGTLFLDEIAAASPGLQVKLLRLIQDRAFERVGESRTRTADVRLILATNVDLAQAVKEGKFREDLFYRVQVIQFDLPPLRDRPGDVLPLARHLLRKVAETHHRRAPRLGRESIRKLMEYSWPGNVRELENALERALLLSPGERLDPLVLPGAGGGGAGHSHASVPLPQLEAGRRYSLKKLLEEPERRILQAALDACEGNREKTAVLLGINRATLFAKMKRLGLGRHALRPGPGRGSGSPENLPDKRAS